MVFDAACRRLLLPFVGAVCCRLLALVVSCWRLPPFAVVGSRLRPLVALLPPFVAVCRRLPPL
eukprot:6382076-Lingulodinium_polyedra.AAC.1